MTREGKVIGLWPQYGASSGLHLLVEWYGCSASRALIEDVSQLRRLCLLAAEGADSRSWTCFFVSARLASWSA